MMVEEDETITEKAFKTKTFNIIFINMTEVPPGPLGQKECLLKWYFSFSKGKWQKSTQTFVKRNCFNLNVTQQKYKKRSKQSNTA